MSLPPDLQVSRRNASLSAWSSIGAAIAGGLIAAIAGYFGVQAGIAAEQDRQEKDHRRQDKYEQITSRRGAYEKYLTVVVQAAQFERMLWCLKETRPIDSAEKIRERQTFGICVDAPSLSRGQAILGQLEVAVASVLQYAGDDTRFQAYGVVQDLTSLLEKYRTYGKAMVETVSTSSDVFVSMIRRDFLQLASTMCEEQALISNSCNTPGK